MNVDGDLRSLLCKLIQDNKELKVQVKKLTAPKPKPARPSPDLDAQFQADLEKAMEASRASAGLSSSSRAGSVASAPVRVKAPVLKVTGEGLIRMDGPEDDEEDSQHDVADEGEDGEELGEGTEEEEEEAEESEDEEGPPTKKARTKKTDPTEKTNPTEKTDPTEKTNPTKKTDPTEKAHEITSTSHRKEYMALSRRMEGIDVSKYPEMSSLWNSSRAETRRRIDHKFGVALF